MTYRADQPMPYQVKIQSRKTTCAKTLLYPHEYPDHCNDHQLMTMDHPTKSEQCNGLLTAKDAQMALHSLTRKKEHVYPTN